MAIEQGSREWHNLVNEIGKAVGWDFTTLNDLYLECLTDINFHSERKKIEPFIKRMENSIRSGDYDDGQMGESVKSFSKSSLRENYNRLSRAAKSRLTESGQKWRADVAGVGEDKWSSNAKTYDSPEEVKKWLDGLRRRWFGYDMARVVPDDTPKNEPIDMDDPTIYQNLRS